MIPAWIDFLDALSERIGRLVAWLSAAMVLIATAVVMLRYGFNLGWVALQETVVMLHGMLFMLGIAYALRHDAHVRVDVLYRRRSPRARAWIDVAGTLLLLWPLCALMFWLSLDYVAAAWRIQESSSQAGGLPGVYIYKTLLLVMPVLTALQGLVLVARNIMTIRTGVERSS